MEDEKDYYIPIIMGHPFEADFVICLSIDFLFIWYYFFLAIIMVKGEARNNISGFIVADLVIAENGTVEAINIIESVPSGVFDKNGENAIKKWQYKPARLNGEPVKQYTKVRLDWNI